MNRFKRQSGVADDWLSDEAPATVESLRSDFRGLIEIFDRHLAALPPDDQQAREHIMQAKAAAERGLRLSRELLDVVRTPH